MPDSPDSRSRAGQAMDRTKSGIIVGARAAIVRDGVRKLSMIAVAELGGVAKATVYNHVRSKPALLALVANDLLERIATAGLGVPVKHGLTSALLAVAATAADDDVIRATAEREPAVVGRLIRVLPTPVWDPARERLLVLGQRHRVELSPPGVDVVLRWLVTQAAAPPKQPERDDVWLQQVPALLGVASHSG